jgi:DNA-binding response OmpR family regulator
MAGAAERVTVLVYSNSEAVRTQLRTAVGRRPAPDVGRIDWVECAAHADFVGEMDRGGIDLVIVDGEAQPTGGMGLARQFKNELLDCPPMVVLIARPQDAWLATWALADDVIHMPIDPVEAADVVAKRLRAIGSTIPVVR